MKKKLLILSIVSIVGVMLLSFTENESTKDEEAMKVVMGTVISHNSGCYTLERCDGSLWNFEDPNNLIGYPYPQNMGYFFVRDVNACGERELTDIVAGFCN